MSTDDDRILTDDDGRPEAPAVVFPGAGLTSTQGLGSGGGLLSGSPIIPPPVVSPTEAGAAPDNLAGRIEQTLAEDGRFTALLSALSLSADDAGHVTVTGSLPDAALKRSLLATVHAIPGVSQVTDETR